MPLDSESKLTQRQALAIYAPRTYRKPSISNAAAGVMMALWRSAGMPTQGAIPVGAATPTAATLGAAEIAAAQPEELMHLSLLQATMPVAGTLLMFDRLAHMGGLSGIVASPTAQTVNLDLATAAGQGRCALNGSDVEWYLEWYTDTGATGVTVTASYTNQDNVGGRTTQAISLPATRRASMCYAFLPQAGDMAIRSIQTVTLSATTGTAGNFGVTARKRLGAVGVATNHFSEREDCFSLGFPSTRDTACLEFLIHPTGTTTGDVHGQYQMISG
ncbi:MAG: hypothetical protein AB1453_10345 [Chloroflexota bacterium]